MMSGRRIDWQDGMLLSATHFRLMEDSVKNAQASQLQYLHPYYWGIQILKFNADALHVGKIDIESISGIFPNGEPFCFNHHHGYSLSISPHSIHQNTLYLTYCMDQIELTDNDQRIGYTPLQLTFDTVNNDTYLSIARIENHNSQLVIEELTAPILSLSASTSIIRNVNRCCDILLATTQDHSSARALKFILEHPQQHPFELYKVLYKIFYDYHLTIKPYDHSNPTILMDMMEQLIAKLRDNTTSYQRIELYRDGLYWHGELPGVSTLSQVIVGIPASLIHNLNDIIIAPTSKIAPLVNHDLPGLTFYETKNNDLLSSPRHYIQYQIDHTHALWNDLEYEKRVSFYFPTQRLNETPRLWIK